MKLSDYFDDTVRSIAFLSRIPVPRSFFSGTGPSISGGVQTFPLAGALILAGPAILLWLLLAADAPVYLAAFLVLTLQTMITGALHEDGLSDAADGLFGGRDKDHALTIMKDSRVGSYGVIAMVLSFGLRASAIGAIATRIDPIEAALCLPAVAALSRALMVWHWSAIGPAKTDGVAASQGEPTRDAVTAALIAAAIVAFALLWPSAGFAPMLFASAMAALACAAFTAFVRKCIGGHTGDTIGATQQICECLMLASLALAV
ncbi:adenosylcobinamide-GDP ribazoletransferase [Agrobacterium sp. ES01]|uniref:adenosylcobinamide-GDP ribazoletransferase n=1 Tax=Agrobacterium sp. ES01 TaxID=3420714 RepID=UPI003D0B651D